MQVGTNSVKIDSTFVAAFNAEQEGTIFTPSIVVNYGNNITTATSPTISVPNFVPIPPPPISFAANGVTIRHTGVVTDIPSSTPLFIEANLRGTGTEWFAVVDNSATPYIGSYAKNRAPGFYADSGFGIIYFKAPGQLQPVPFNNIVTTHITNMYGLFYEVGVFTDNVSSWDTSNVTNMYRAFWRSSFNSEINDWDVSNVTNMGLLFNDNGHFNKPLNKWNTSKVTNMQNMFKHTFFNQDISEWNVTLTTARPSLIIDDFASGCPLALPENSHKLPPFE
jgi:surface protein